jgi:hypothetical protein
MEKSGFLVKIRLKQEVTQVGLCFECPVRNIDLCVSIERHIECDSISPIGHNGGRRMTVHSDPRVLIMLRVTLGHNG